MAANVTIHHTAFSDRRIAYLGELAGYSTMEALGRLAALWSRCTELQNDRPGVYEIRACLGPRGEQHLIESGLGEEIEGDIRVRGCEGRHEWYGEVGPGAPRQTAGGKARAAQGQRDAKGRLLPSSKSGPAAQVAGEMLEVAGPATVQQPSNRPASESESGTRARDQITHTRVRERHPDAGAIASRTWDYGAKLRGELAAANVLVPPWALQHGSDHSGWTELLDRVCELLVDSTAEEAERICRNRIDVAAAKARTDAEGHWFSNTSLFTRKSFEHWAHQDVKQFTRKPAQPTRTKPGGAIGSASPRKDFSEESRAPKEVM